MTAAAAASHPRVRVALQGFSEFERSALASYFRLAGDRFPAYEQTDSPEDARFIVADADHPGVVDQVIAAGRVADTVFIGAQAPEGALAWMMRPIDPLHVLRELDGVVGQRWAGAAAPPTGRRASDLPEPARTVSPQVLLVDPNDLSARTLERQLQALGLSVARANTSGKALELMARLAFQFVFVDTELGAASEMDGLNLCQHVKHQHAVGTGTRPAVFLLSDTDAPVQRVRATLAGADAYLVKPVDDGSLRRLLAAHGATFTRPGPVRAIQR
ncbi:response regulator [Ideonella sp. BN130291]|uniref:response regulator n=1 Tax=Ideonella sp. BN130291 TaxID=3112940 RepID=UPI002E2752CB|nr:response regulator [Ideonella sp. BN130291]